MLNLQMLLVHKIINAIKKPCYLYYFYVTLAVTTVALNFICSLNLGSLECILWQPFIRFLLAENFLYSNLPKMAHNKSKWLWTKAVYSCFLTESLVNHTSLYVHVSSCEDWNISWSKNHQNPLPFPIVYHLMCN